MRTASTAAAIVGISMLLAACGGGPQFTYLTSEDGHAFSKIPDDWTVIREGAVAWSLLDDSRGTQLGFVTGDDTTPWRAVFTADPRGRFDLDRPAGLVEVQHVDARIRDRFEVKTFLKTVPDFGDAEAIADAEIETIDERPVRVGELTGYRAVLSAETVGRRYEQLVLTDRENRALYILSVSCSASCLDQYADEIDEIIRTFRVEL